MIVEAEGTLCEGQELETGSIYQGSCPGWYNYEYTTGIKAVKHNSIVSNASLKDEEELEGSKISTEYAVKIYERDLQFRFLLAKLVNQVTRIRSSVYLQLRMNYSKSMYKPTKKKFVDSFDEVESDEIDMEE